MASVTEQAEMREGGEVQVAVVDSVALVRVVVGANVRCQA